MAEAICKQLLVERGHIADWQVDSAGTGPWHVGKRPDPRTCAILDREGIALDRVARQLRKRDYSRFDWLLAMDDDNLATLHERRPRTASADIALIGDYDPDGEREVPDPYYGGDDGFERIYAMLRRSCAGFLDEHAR